MGGESRGSPESPLAHDGVIDMKRFDGIDRGVSLLMANESLS